MTWHSDHCLFFSAHFHIFPSDIIHQRQNQTTLRNSCIAGLLAVQWTIASATFWELLQRVSIPLLLVSAIVPWLTVDLRTWIRAEGPIRGRKMPWLESCPCGQSKLSGVRTSMQDRGVVKRITMVKTAECSQQKQQSKGIKLDWNKGLGRNLRWIPTFQYLKDVSKNQYRYKCICVNSYL